MKKYVLIIFFASVVVPYYCFSQTDSTNKQKTFELFPNVGVGLVRSTLSPLFNINLIYTKKDALQIRLSTSSYFFFQPADSKPYKTYRSSFVNAEFLVRGWYDKGEGSKIWNGLGVGYLIESSGNYFKGTTMKLYYFNKFKFFSTKLEVVFTDNFKTVFPGITVVF